MNNLPPIKILIFLLLGMLTSQSAQADILAAMKAYQEQRHEEAFNSFKHLAKLGNDRARYNLAVMLSKGQGVEQDLIQAYAWAQLTDHRQNPEYMALKDALNEALSEAQKPIAALAAEDLNKQFGDQAIKARWAPVSNSNPSGSQRTDNKKHTPFSVRIIERPAPRYPKSEFRFGTQGWVRVGFDIYPDGSVRNPYLIESVPEDVFDEVTLEAIAGFRFAVEFAKGTEPHPIHSSQTIQYNLASSQSKQSLEKMYQDRLDQLKKNADAGHPTAQYYYALAASEFSLIKDQVALTAEQANQWLLKAAQNGNTDAQFQLGYNIFYGKGCQADRQRGVNWMTLAAEQGHAKAARQAYLFRTRFDLLNESERTAEYWLAKAAESGDVEARLDYAHHLAFATEVSKEDRLLIKDYLNAYRTERDQSIKYYQVLAQYHSLLGEDKKARKAQKKVDKLAKKLGWDLSI